MLGLFLFLSLAFGDAICADGWYSSSTGRGTCSHHGGVSSWVVPGAPVYTQPTPKVSNDSFLSIEGNQKVWRDSNGSLHRLNGPAIENPNYKAYFIHGFFGRLDGGPTYTIDDNDLHIEEWLVGDWIPHKTNGPAIKSHIKLYDETISIYAENGRLHRVEGPAIIYYSGPNKHVEIFCRDGFCTQVRVYFDQYLFKMDFASLSDSSVKRTSQTVDTIYSNSLGWCRALTSEDPLREMVREMIDVKSFTDEYGITYTLTQKGDLK